MRAGDGKQGINKCWPNRANLKLIYFVTQLSEFRWLAGCLLGGIFCSTQTAANFGDQDISL